MLVQRIIIALAAGSSLFAALPASAQFFFQPVDLTGAPVDGTEPGMTGPVLKGATKAELRAALAWNMRAALNVAALQCQFEPSLLTLDYYNTLLKDHSPELLNAYSTLEKYFVRVAPNKKAGQIELDRYGTRIYSGFSTVGGQLSFCRTASILGREAVFTPRGGFSTLAENRMRELRASLQPWGDQYRPPRTAPVAYAAMHRVPPFADKKCWKKDDYLPNKCGAFTRG